MGRARILVDLPHPATCLKCGARIWRFHSNHLRVVHKMDIIQQPSRKADREAAAKIVRRWFSKD